MQQQYPYAGDEDTNTTSSASGGRNLGKLLKFYESVSSATPSTSTAQPPLKLGINKNGTNKKNVSSFNQSRLRTQSLDSLEEEFTVECKHYSSGVVTTTNKPLVAKDDGLDYLDHEEDDEDQDSSSCEMAEIKIDLEYDLV